MTFSNNFFRGSLALSLAIQMAGCGGKDKEGAVAPLSSSERQQVLGVVKSTIRSVGSTAQSFNSYVRKNGKFDFNLDSLARLDSSGGSSSDDHAVFNTMSSELDECTMGMTGLDDMSSSGSQIENFMKPMEGSFTAGGEKCPIKMDSKFSTNVSQDQKSLSGSFSMSYQVLSPEYKKLNDVDGIDFKLQLSASQGSGNSGTATLTLSSTLHSQKSGNIFVNGSLNFAASEKSASLNSKIELTLGSTSAVFEIKVADLNTAPEILLNGQKLSKEELQDLFSDLDDSSENSSGGSSSSGSTSGSTPTSTPVAPANPAPVAGQPYLGTFENVKGTLTLGFGGVATLYDADSMTTEICDFTVNNRSLTVDCNPIIYFGEFTRDFSGLLFQRAAYSRVR